MIIIKEFLSVSTVMMSNFWLSFVKNFFGYFENVRGFKWTLNIHLRPDIHIQLLNNKN